MIDLGRAIKAAATTGKVVYGVQQAEKAVTSGEAKMIIVAENCPSEFLRSGNHSTKVYKYEGSNMELGALCGKPFSVSALAVIDKGTSNILSL
ncbi:50S ribosomal protein L30e [Methanomassiliicoccus luminyensis]|jgi:large subunit ribosomal protein L30e|uniref:50S ribosomal protein L30e n=1 Tax=Methanomassiliicoccus luminyensis TaxID=1080712 RepID=UPI000673F082|nr:50S ribosomal protein L30e [Methanomassiliicoccus luminyensis]